MPPRQVELPAPADRIWNPATRLVRELINQCKTLEHDDWYLGGGTALSADWHHRESTDIDILIAPGLSMAALRGDSEKRIDEVIAATNGSRIKAPDQKLSVAYGDSGKVDIFSSGRQLPGHEQHIEVSGMSAYRLSDAQIFAGKFRRAIAEHIAARDLFDICHAARTGRPSMQQALNTFTEPELKIINTFWRNSSEKIAEEARKKLSGVAHENCIEPNKLTEQAIDIIHDHRYATMVISGGNDRASITTTTNAGLVNQYTSTSNSIDRDFSALGISRHLIRHNIRPSHAIHETREAMRGHTERTVIRTGSTPRPTLQPPSRPAPGGGDSAGPAPERPGSPNTDPANQPKRSYQYQRD